MSRRPLFSLVIACYNNGKYKKGVYLDRLLDSVTQQGIEKDELEVILADDCSPVLYDDIVIEYEDKLIIKRIKTDYNFAPGNTRAKGVSIATGEWLCFADHDDIYYPNALKLVKQGIENRNEQHFVLTNFKGVDPDGKVLREYNKVLNWCHGKFYNKDNFWDKFNIAFVHDLKSHEDIAICTQVGCALSNIGNTFTYMNFASYAWTDNPQSVSHAKYFVEGADGQRYFLEVFFRDYLEATGYIYLREFARHTIKMRFAVKCAIEILVYCYIYTQGFQFARKDFLTINLAYAGEYLNGVRRTFNVTNQDIYNAIAENNAEMYRKIRPLADPGAGAYIPQQSFRDWLELISDCYTEALETGELSKEDIKNEKNTDSNGFRTDGLGSIC